MEEPAFLAYSITKTFTAVLILELCEERRLSLDDRLANWFPHIAHADRISLRHLLNHTGGIPDYGGVRAYHESVKSSPSAPWSFERFAAETFDKGLLFEPGEGWAYSNPGYMLLKRIAEEVTSNSYSALIADRIARPLGLRRTLVAESISDLAALAPGTSSALSRGWRSARHACELPSRLGLARGRRVHRFRLWFTSSTLFPRSSCSRGTLSRR